MADPEWRIYYADCVVRGHSREEWEAAPAQGVQVVALMVPPAMDERRWTGVSDRQLWTGEDEYDPFGWGAKSGALISDADYERTWREAFYAHR
jgi:hypothetical protein